MKTNLIRSILKIAAVGLIAASIVGCSSNRKKTDADANAAGGATSGQVESTPISFDPSGSDSGKITGLQTVRFPYDSSSLTASETAKLRGNAEWLKSNSRVNLTVEGHCDQRGSNEYNLALGERRAAAVKALLVEMGVAANRLTTVSFGEEKPAARGESDSDMALNRRANFVPNN